MSYAILLLAIAEFGLLIWAIRRWTIQPSNIALLLTLLIVLPVCLDAATIAGGRWIGFGPTLETLNRIRFSWFVFSMPMMWVICLSVLANAGFSWAQNRALLIGLLVAAVTLGGYEAIQAWQQVFHPACVFDIKRYVFQVPAGQECMGSTAGDGTFGLPLVVPLGMLCVALTGAVLWWKRDWPWLALICATLIAILAVPRSDYSTFLSYPADGTLTAVLVFTAIRFFRPAEPRAQFAH